MVNQQYQNADLFRSTEPVTLTLPIPRIEIIRHWSRGTGFDKSEKPMWRVSPVGLNGQPLPKEDEVPMRDEAEHIADQWHALLGWPCPRCARIREDKRKDAETRKMAKYIAQELRRKP